MKKVLVDQNSSIIKYPADLNDLRNLHPNTSIPTRAPVATLEALGLIDVLEMDAPSYDLFSQRLTELSPALQDGIWVQQWRVDDIDPNQLYRYCDYQAFWDALLISPIYQVIRAQAISDLNANTCCTEFIAAMGDAKAGRPNRNALQACIWLLMAALTLSPEQVQALQELLAIGHLDRLYSLTPPA